MFICCECQRTIYWETTPIMLDVDSTRLCCEECYPHVLQANPAPALTGLQQRLEGLTTKQYEAIMYDLIGNNWRKWAPSYDRKWSALEIVQYLLDHHLLHWCTMYKRHTGKEWEDG